MTPIAKSFVKVDGTPIAFTSAGAGDPIVLIHGNPTSSYLWRDITPHLSHLGRCLAPDLLGMGDSGKLADSGPTSYTFSQHSYVLDRILSEVGACERVTLVLHDWGSALGFDWAYRHPGAVRAIVYMEAIVAPLTWADLPEAAVEMFKALRSPAGEAMILDENMFVEGLLPAGVLTPLAPETLAEYRRPFTSAGESRRPTLTWPRQIPIDGEPADVDHAVANYSEWMARNDIPKLFVNADPGMVLVGRSRNFCRSWPNQTEVTVPGLHFIQEDSGPRIGEAVAKWLTRVGGSGPSTPGPSRTSARLRSVAPSGPAFTER
jgi:haloalkane dehalogenase